MARAEVAQSVEHSTENAGVASSILALGTSSGLNFGRLRLGDRLGCSGAAVEQLLSKEKVTGSNPVFRSNSSSDRLLSSKN